MELALIAVPFHLGRERIGTGLGPERLLRASIGSELASQGHTVNIEKVRYPTNIERDEVSAIAEINALLAQGVRRALGRGGFPLVLAGDCNASLGTLAGMETRPVGVIWLDAHGDFNTPETSTSGFLDGMVLAMVMGLCHRAIWTSLGGLPIRGWQIVHIGGRAFDEGEKERLMSDGVRVVTASQLKQVGPTTSLRPLLSALRAQVRDIYLHVDLDVLDPVEGRANKYAAPDGLSLRDLGCVIRLVAEAFEIKAAALTAYDPACDGEGRALDSGIRVIHTLVDTVAQKSYEREFD
ncbi:MAG: arginase family protein [Anaerolineae bacterium]|nr:arginase family protein [Anaerolineae bacterium]